ncbi:MAG: HD domain-containing protein [Synergistaceae bacterium]|nr:HD domain-containing protein [Synergistaceae bacterium]
MLADLVKVKAWFDGYVRSFDLSVPMIRMKYEHSYDVMRVGEALTKTLAWPPNDAAVGIAACLLHDTGRFSQYRDFGTYNDGASVDHGDCGYETLRREFFGNTINADSVDDEGQKVILQAVKWHNKKSLPELHPDLSSDALLFCWLARDADKLDVFRLVRRRMDEGTIGGLLPRHKIGAPLSTSLLEEVETFWSGSYKNASSLQDFLLIQLTWTLDINFAPSLQILEKSGVLTHIRDCFPKDDARVQTLLEGLFVRIEEHKRAIAEK